MGSLFFRPFKKAFSLIVLAALVSPPCAAAATPSNSNHYYSIRQESYRKNGVLVTRPAERDRKMVELLYHNNIRSLDDYVLWLKKRMRYQKELSGDLWQAPEEFLRSKEGDCEDFALLNAAVSRVLGFQPRIVALVRPGTAHAICVFQQGDVFVWFDNDRLQETRAGSLEEFARQIADEYRYSALLELDTETRRWQKIYKKS